MIYFDNMDDFHMPGYELFFCILAFFVMLAAALPYCRSSWLAPTLIGLLLVRFGQGLSFFGIESTPFAIAYNLVTMFSKVPPLILAMIVPVYCAIGTRRPGLACLSFAVPSGADFPLNLTRLAEKSIEGVLPGQIKLGPFQSSFPSLCGLISARFIRGRDNVPASERLLTRDVFAC